MKSPVFVLLLLISFSLSGQISVGKVNIQELYENDPQYTQKMEAVQKFGDSLYTTFQNSSRYIDMKKEAEEYAEKDPNHSGIQNIYLQLNAIYEHLDGEVQNKMNSLFFTPELREAFNEVQEEHSLESYFLCNSQGSLLSIEFQTSLFETKLSEDIDARKKELAKPYLDKENEGMLDYQSIVREIMEGDYSEEIILSYYENSKDYTREILTRVY